MDSYATIAELVERAKDLQKEDTRIAELGLSEEELAFYDILAAKKEIIKEEGPIQDIVHGVVQAVKNGPSRVLSQILAIVGLMAFVGHSYPARAANCLNGH